MDKFEKVTKGIESCSMFLCKDGNCPYQGIPNCSQMLAYDALNLSKNMKPRDVILKAIIRVAGYNNIEEFENKVIEVNGIGDYWLGGVYASFNAVKKLFDEGCAENEKVD